MRKYNLATCFVPIMIALHTPTLGLIVTLMLVMVAGLMLFVLKTRTTYSGFGWWAAGFVLLAGCFLLSVLRDALDSPAAILISNILGIASLCLFYDGIAGFYQREEPRPNFLNYGLAAVVVAMLAFYLYRTNDLNSRIVWFNVFQLFVTLRIARHFYSHAIGKQRSATLLMCAIFYGTAAASIWRIIAVLRAPAMTDLLVEDTTYRLMILIAAMLAFSLAFCFLLLTHIRIEEELEAARANAEHFARVDALTGLWNRRHFEAEAQREIERAGRYGQPVALMLFDIDHFKQVNDRLGHLGGDEVLKRVAGIVRSTMRASDLVCRWGGEEFAIVMPATIGEAMQAAEKLRLAIDRGDFAQGGRMTISVGCAQWCAGEDLGAWSRRADHALYRAKAAGRNRVEAAEAAPASLAA